MSGIAPCLVKTEHGTIPDTSSSPDAAALEDPNPEALFAAIADVAKARGMTQLAKDTGLGRESLDKALAPGAKPRYDTVLKLVHGLGVKLTVTRLGG